MTHRCTAQFIVITRHAFITHPFFVMSTELKREFKKRKASIKARKAKKAKIVHTEQKNVLPQTTSSANKEQELDRELERALAEHHGTRRYCPFKNPRSTERLQLDVSGRELEDVGIAQGCTNCHGLISTNSDGVVRRVTAAFCSMGCRCMHAVVASHDKKDDKFVFDDPGHLFSQVTLVKDELEFVLSNGTLIKSKLSPSDTNLLTLVAKQVVYEPTRHFCDKA